MSQVLVRKPQEEELVQIEAEVKWFSPEKGYGFLAPDDGTSDIFMHFSVLEAAGHHRIEPADMLVCEISPGDRGRQVRRILEVRLLPNEMRQTVPVFHMAYGRYSTTLEKLEDVYGEVKWFNPIRGYGFIEADDGDCEVFVDASVLRPLGYQALEQGQRVFVKASRSHRGREARILKILR